MTEVRAQVVNKVREIVSTVFEIPLDAVITSTTNNDVKAWDSVGHLNLVLALQEEFFITVPPEDLETLANVEAIIEYVITSTGASSGTCVKTGRTRPESIDS